MIFTDRTIIVQKGTSSINDTIVLYRGDKGVEIRFTLNEGSPFKFSSGTSSNIIEKTEATYGQLIIKTPDALPPIFSEVTPTIGGKIIFTITAEMINETTEVGNYTFQIRLLDDNMESRATLPEVKNGIEIREPIAIEDASTTNEVGLATVGYAMTTAGTTEDAFDSQGNYNKTTWGTGDRITAAKLNKIEAGIDGVNQKVASGSTGGETGVDLSIYQTKTDNTLNTTNKTVSGAINEINEAMVIAEEQSSNKASDITITDTAGNYTSNNVEGALQEVGSQIKEKANLSDVSKISNGTPLFAEDINDMTDNTRNYVNLNDGFLYSYSNNGFINTNLKYQEMGLSNKQVTPDKTSFLNSQVLVNKTISKTLNNANNWWETLETCSVNSEGKLLIMACDDIIINPTPTAGWLQVDFKNSSDSTLGAFSLDYNASSFNKSKVIPEGTEKVVLRACFDWSAIGNLSIEFKNFKLYVDEISLSDDISVPYLEKEINKLQSIEKVYSIKNISRKGASLTLLHHKPSIDTSITDYRVTPLLKIDDFEYKDLKLKGVPYRDTIEFFDNQKIKIGKLSPVDENYIITENEETIYCSPGSLVSIYRKGAGREFPHLPVFRTVEHGR